MLPGASPFETVAMTGLAEVADFWPMFGVPHLFRVAEMAGDVWLAARLEAAAFEAARAALTLAYPAANISSSVCISGIAGGSVSTLGRTRSSRSPE